MEPNEFVQVLSENGQIPSMVGEVARNKALAIVLGRAEVTDTNGNKVDLAEFTAVDNGDEDGENIFEEVVETAEAAEASDAEAAEVADAEVAEKPAKKSKKK